MQEEVDEEVDNLVRHYELMPHPEGGFFKETYRAATTVNIKNDQGVVIERSASTAIIFLITKSNVSRLHRIRSDEGWHYYSGSPLTVVELDPETKKVKLTKIGPNLSQGEKVQYIVPAGVWFGSYTDVDCSLVGCTVAPGFIFEDFELASKELLLSEFSSDESTQHMIEKLCKGL